MCAGGGKRGQGWARGWGWGGVGATCAGARRRNLAPRAGKRGTLENLEVMMFAELQRSLVCANRAIYRYLPGGRPPRFPAAFAVGFGGGASPGRPTLARHACSAGGSSAFLSVASRYARSACRRAGASRSGSPWKTSGGRQRASAERLQLGHESAQQCSTGVAGEIAPTSQPGQRSPSGTRHASDVSRCTHAARSRASAAAADGASSSRRPPRGAAPRARGGSGGRR